ncbi:cyd operon YbgE family protein [Sodalis sp.]|uniref:cyd operon YbgE family protein n=1 Tax=Sodalis sp. (in: enterobacteria) TaxID=1898979 RepID=UPI003873082C
MLYDLTDNRPLWALFLVMVLTLAGCVFWTSSRFAAQISSLSGGRELVIILGRRYGL